VQWGVEKNNKGQGAPMANTQKPADGEEPHSNLGRLVFMTLLAISLGVFEEVADPFGLDTETDRLSANIFNTITSPFYGQDSSVKLTVTNKGVSEEKSFESRFGQSNIVVLLIDDDYLDAVNKKRRLETPTLETPTLEPPTLEPPTLEPPTLEPRLLEPRHYQRILRKLVDAGASAVFVDFYFIQNSRERSESVGNLFRQSRCLTAKSACSIVEEDWSCTDIDKRLPCNEPDLSIGTEIFFAGTLRNPRPTAGGEKPADTALAQMSGDGSFYHLQQTIGVTDYDTAAWALYQAWCRRDARCESDRLDDFPLQAMYLHWGYAPNRMMTEVPDFGIARPPSDKPSTWGQRIAEFFVGGAGKCVPQARTMIGRLGQSIKVFIWNFIKGFHDEDSLCLYHSQIKMQLFNNLSPDELNELFGRKVVFLGASLKDFPDNQWSPVHGYMPGVFWHAMAVDNLMEFSDSYMVEAPDDVGGYVEPVGIAFIFILQALLTWTIQRREEREKLDEMARLKLDLLHGLMIICVISTSVLWMTGLQRWSPANWIGFAMLMFLIDFKPVTAVGRFCWRIFPTVRMTQRPFQFMSNLVLSTGCVLGMLFTAYCIFVLPHALMLQRGIDDTTISYIFIFLYMFIVIWPCGWKIFRRES